MPHPANKHAERLGIGPDRLEAFQQGWDCRQREIGVGVPSYTEVAEYIVYNGYNVDPHAWLDHYLANGFTVGKVKMKDWKAAVRTWARNSQGFSRQPQRQFEIKAVNV